MIDSKNTIKKRMIATAAKAWGVSVKDIEKADPVVPMLIEACAGEISRIYSGMSDNSEKLVGKIMELLTPMELTSPFPARAVIHAMPMEASSYVNDNNEFYKSKKVYVEENVKDIDIHFTPTGKYRIINGDVGYLATGNRILKIADLFETEEFCKSDAGKKLETNTLWIGLLITKHIDSLDGLSFYFNFDSANLSEIEKETFFHALLRSQWYINEEPVNITNGFPGQAADTGNIQNFNSNREFSKSASICNHINNFYKKQFYTLTGNDNLSGQSTNVPGSFKEVFTEDDLAELEKNVIWVKVALSQYLSDKILSHVTCAINCFPVINRRNERVFITGREKIKGLESENNETFLDLKQYISGDLDVIFNNKNKDIESGQALLSLRQDNIGRFSSRNALELVQQLITTYREEFPAFSKFKNINQDAIDNLNHAIRPFEYILDELNAISFDSMPYIILNTNPEDDDLQVRVEYWLTNGSLANNLRREEHMMYDSAELIRDKIFLMTDTAGGIDRKRNEELVNDFRYALITRDRIVTKMDIKALCYKVFDGSIDRIEVSEGVTSSTLPYSGIRRCINVNIKLSGKNKMDDETISFLKRDLITRLTENSSAQVPIRVFTK